VSGFSAFRNGRVRSDFSAPDAHGPEIVTTGLIVRSVDDFALITAHVLTFFIFYSQVETLRSQ